MRALAIPGNAVQAVSRRESEEVARREQAYRGSRAYPDLRGRTVILVDDGLATGATVRAAAAALKRQGVGRLVVAVPVGSPDACRELEAVANEVVCATTPEWFRAVGQFYEEFGQTSDEEVGELLDRASRERPAAAAGP